MQDVTSIKNNFKLEITNFFINFDFLNNPIHRWDMNDFNLMIIKVIQKIEEFELDAKLVDYRLVENIISLWFEIENKILNLEMKLKDNNTALIKWK